MLEQWLCGQGITEQTELQSRDESIATRLADNDHVPSEVGSVE